jgi:hypothetical protein
MGKPQKSSRLGPFEFQVDKFARESPSSAVATAELVELPPVSLGRSTSAAISFEDRRGQRIAFRRWRTVIDEARHRNRCADALRQDRNYIDNSFPLIQTCFDSIANLDRRRRLRWFAIDLDVPRPTCPSGVGTRFGESNRPQPLINSSALHGSILHQKLAICRARLA